jgi:hypothetical protein
MEIVGKNMVLHLQRAIKSKMGCVPILRLFLFSNVQ